MNKYQQIAEEYIDKVRERYPDLKIRYKGKEPFSAVVYTDGSATLTTAKPTNLYGLFVTLHECGHYLLGHSADPSTSSTSRDEFQADEFALKILRSHGLEPNARIGRSILDSESNAVYADMWTGRRVSGDALKTIGGEATLQKDKHNWKALQTEIAERRAGVPEQDRTYRYEGAYV